ncbi:GSCFA family protein [Gemmobacter megaterium]|uniref:GSCFA family protein n=1 Tax=Gemmobacter megaterium TaxID=1086013 RepID=A0A1N7QIG5_9RHOB|nr:GSCFA domain-containing protein [Gemmobacter megaterium]GGE26473.1 hypothetical protein GCM10011345_35560 [Gemmobacter megaterium]SIT22297.1 GSCFA family protein [Gemmobacter megaterium]
MKHPYVGLPDRQFWKKEPGIQDAYLLDPVGPVTMTLTRQDRIVTAGSCFAQHVARFLSQSGYNHYIAERAHPIVPARVAQTHNYGLFSARYGNIYTARQLKQLLQRAYGEFDPCEISWQSPHGEGVVDPFRPQIQPGGFLGESELLADRSHHFSCIREALENMDVFIFTLGLTEAWVDRRDGAVFPIAPGIAGGQYDPGTVAFQNFDEEETWEDLRFSLEFLRWINPCLKIILTVSPVPLNATYENRHVLVSTAWSKAVLRIVAEKAMRAFDDCVYFPSYELITSPHVMGQYYENDRREVREAGVSHVMALFMAHFTEGGGCSSRVPPEPVAVDSHLAEMERKIEVLCDEAAITNE